MSIVSIGFDIYDPTWFGSIQTVFISCYLSNLVNQTLLFIFCFTFIQSDSLCPLIGKLNLLTFSWVLVHHTAVSFSIWAMSSFFLLPSFPAFFKSTDFFLKHVILSLLIAVLNPLLIIPSPFLFLYLFLLTDFSLKFGSRFHVFLQTWKVLIVCWMLWCGYLYFIIFLNRSVKFLFWQAVYLPVDPFKTCMHRVKKR